MRQRLTAALVVGAAAVGLSACATNIEIHKVGAQTYLVCDSTKHGDCDGANPEKGIERVCFPKSEVPIKIQENAVQQGILVTCGKTTK